MDFFCLPIIFGCPTKIHQEGDPTPRRCPRCNNASVVQAKARTWFELFWIPLIPMSSSHIWVCSICQWQVPLQQGWEPQPATMGYPPQGWHPGPGPMSPPNQSGYQPTYLNQQK